MNNPTFTRIGLNITKNLITRGSSPFVRGSITSKNGMMRGADHGAQHHGGAQPPGEVSFYLFVYSLTLQSVPFPTGMEGRKGAQAIFMTTFAAIAIALPTFAFILQQ
jgi:hypothetical protein